MNKKEITFITLNGLLNGKDLRQIASNLNISESIICEAIGVESYAAYDEMFAGAKAHFELSDEEKVLLNFLAVPEYVSALLDTGEEVKFYGYDVLQSMAFSNMLNLSIIPGVFKEFLPKIKMGNTPMIADGYLYLPEKYIRSEIALDNLLIDVFNYHFYAKPLLTKKQAKRMLENLSLSQAPDFTPKDVSTILSAVAKKGYCMSAVNDLFGLALHDYVESYAITGAVMDYDGSDNLRLLNYGKNDSIAGGLVLMVPANVLPKLSKSPRLFDGCYYEKGNLYVKTNVGYKQLILHEEVFA